MVSDIQSNANIADMWQAAAEGFKTIMSGNESETLVAHEDILRIQNLKELQGLDLNVINSFAFAFEEQCFETGDVICPLGGGEGLLAFL